MSTLIKDKLCANDALSPHVESIRGKSKHKDVPGYEGLYTVDTAGNVFGLVHEDYLKWTKAPTGWIVRLSKGSIKTTTKVANIIIKTL